MPEGESLDQQKTRLKDFATYEKLKQQKMFKIPSMDRPPLEPSLYDKFGIKSSIEMNK